MKTKPIETSLLFQKIQLAGVYKLRVSRAAIEAETAIDLLAADDPETIILHIKPLSDHGIIVMNDRHNGKWGARKTLPFDMGALPDLLLSIDGSRAELATQHDSVGFTLTVPKSGEALLKCPPGFSMKPAFISSEEIEKLRPMSPSFDQGAGPQHLNSFALAFPNCEGFLNTSLPALRIGGFSGLCVPVPPTGQAVPPEVNMTILPVWSDGRDVWLKGRVAETDWINLSSLASAMSDSRAMRIGERPVLIVSHQSLARGGAAALRAALRRLTGTEPLLVIGQTMRAGADPIAEGYDAAMIFPRPVAKSGADLLTLAKADLAKKVQPTYPGFFLQPIPDTDPSDIPMLAHWARATIRRSLIAPLSGQPVVIFDAGESPAPDTGLQAVKQALQVRHPEKIDRIALSLPIEPRENRSTQGVAVLLKRHFGAEVLMVAEESAVPGALPTDMAFERMVSSGIRRIARIGCRPESENFAKWETRSFDSRAANDPELAREVLEWACPQRQRISVVVPSWQSEPWIADRLQSIFRQTSSIHEIILIDDASTDNTVAIAQKTADQAARAIHIHQCKTNSGNVTHQWRLACEMATGDLLWIAEADDSADPRFLEVLSQRLHNAPDGAFAFCDSGEVNSEGVPQLADRKAYYAAAGEHCLLSSADYPTEAFAKSMLGARNLVLTSSAVLWRRANLSRAFEALGPRAESFRFAGDWQIYLQACTEPGVVAYCSEPLVRQRRHASSVIGSAAPGEHFAEIRRIHNQLRERFPGDVPLFERLERCQREMRKIWKLPDTAIDTK